MNCFVKHDIVNRKNVCSLGQFMSSQKSVEKLSENLKKIANSCKEDEKFRKVNYNDDFHDDDNNNNAIPFKISNVEHFNDLNISELNEYCKFATQFNVQKYQDPNFSVLNINVFKTSNIC